MLSHILVGWPYKSREQSQAPTDDRGGACRSRTYPSGLPPNGTVCMLLPLGKVPRAPSGSRTCLIVGLQPIAWPSGPCVIEEQEPAVGLEPTWSALRGRCPACRASPACCSSQCWCRANSTEVQSLSPLPRAWPEVDPE